MKLYYEGKSFIIFQPSKHWWCYARVNFKKFISSGSAGPMDHGWTVVAANETLLKWRD